MEYRAGVIAGAGAKIYLSPSAFFNTGLVIAHAKPSATSALSPVLDGTFEV